MPSSDRAFSDTEPLHDRHGQGRAELIDIPVLPDYLPGFYVSVMVMSPRVDALMSMARSKARGKFVQFEPSGTQVGASLAYEGIESR